MGIFGKIKNILFEPDEEELVEDMHVYTKEEVKEVPKKEEVVHVEEKIQEPPVRATNNNSHFSNVKRDIDIDYEDKKVLGEVPGVMEAMSSVAESQARVLPKKEEERPSPFQSFDEKEFERVNSRVAKNESEHRIKKDNQDSTSSPVSSFRKANGLFSSTTPVTSNEDKISSIDVSSNVKKPFKPSPVISPVYGILDKNYRKDDIVDKKDGMKREKVVKPIKKEEEVEVDHSVDIDSVRKKAYGTLDDIEREMEAHNNFGVLEDTTFPVLDTKDDDVIEINDVLDESIDVHIDEQADNTVEDKEEDVSLVEVSQDYDQIDDDLTLGDLIKSQNANMNNEDSNLMVEDELEEEFDSNNSNDNYEIKEISSEDKEEDSEKNEDTPRPRLLDDMEKTSTLQILDDIEKELNAIKPISKEVNDYSEEEMKEKIEKSETLENDLFNLIDSMYEQGEEEEDD